MESPGEYLKRERELRGVSLEDIAETVKLSVRVMRALEDDRYDELPHPTYVKGFIRCYARCLGLDENDAVLRYEAYLREKEGEEKKLKLKDRKKENKPPVIPAEERMPFLKPNKMLVACFIAAGIAVIALYLLLGGGPAYDKGAEDAAGRRVAAAPEEVKPGPGERVKPEGAGPADRRREEAKLPESEVKVQGRKAEAEKEGETAGDVSATRSVAGKKPVKEEMLLLDVLAKDTTWIQAEIDGTRQVEVLLRKGEHVRWKAAEVFF